MASFMSGTPAPANELYAAPNGAASGGAGPLPVRPSGQPHLEGRLTPPRRAAPRRRQAKKLSKEIRASLGTQRDRHTRCIRCWGLRGPDHSSWLNCRFLCPRCPDNDQHWKNACPQLLDETNDEWWISHAGCHKPEWRLLNAKAFRAPLPHAVQPFAAGNNDNNGIKFEEGRVENRTFPAPLRGGDDTYRPGRARSRSPERESVVEYRARDGVLLAWRPERGSLLTGNHSSPALQAQVGQTVGSGAEGLAVQQPSGSAGSSNGGGSSGATPRPTAIIWSDGSTTNPSIRELLMQDPWMTMLVHQTVLLADFFERHPDATNGEAVVSEGMRGYLADIRRDCPAYLSPASARNGHGSPLNGDGDLTMLNVDPEASRK